MAHLSGHSRRRILDSVDAGIEEGSEWMARLQNLPGVVIFDREPGEDELIWGSIPADASGLETATEEEDIKAGQIFFRFYANDVAVIEPDVGPEVELPDIDRKISWKEACEFLYSWAQEHLQTST